jgi:hypothetical protein
MHLHRDPRRQQGHAIAETMIALLALAPFIAGIPLLGKQLDIKHKALDAARYAVWERAVWRSDGAKTAEAILLEARDRALGDPRTGIVDLDTLYTAGITENRFWQHAHERLLDVEGGRSPLTLMLEQRTSPAAIGQFVAPGVAHGDGALAAAVELLQVDSLGFERRRLAYAELAVDVRPLLSERARTKPTLGERMHTEGETRALVHRARGALLSDTWSAQSENDFRARIDRVTPNEALAALELPGRAIGLNALGKGRPLYGEGQFAWDPDLRPYTNIVPSLYLRQR